jgi:HEAT repeat protein
MGGPGGGRGERAAGRGAAPVWRPGRAPGAVAFGAAVLALACCGAAPARAQISSQQVRQRYEKSTKGTSIDDFVRRLASKDPETRLEAVKSLGGTKDGKAVEYLIQALGDPDMRVKAKAVDMLGEMRATDATPVLIQYLFLRDTEGQMKQSILAALGKIGDPRAAQPIIEFLQRPLDAATRGTAIYALGDIGASASAGALRQIAHDDKNPTLRRLAEEALNKVQAHQAVMRNEAKAPTDTFLNAKDKEQPPQP